MQTKVVSFRLPVKDYALLLSQAADKNMDLSDLVISKLYTNSPKEFGNLLLDGFDMKKEYAKLIYQISTITSEAEINTVHFDESYLISIKERLKFFDVGYIKIIKKELELTKPGKR
jgi:hypothetical protein